MRAAFLLISAVAVLALSGVGGAAPSTAPSEAGPAAGAAKPKRCKTVVKKIRGKKRRVRVCPKPKPKPKPAQVPRPNPRSVSVELDAARAKAAVVGTSGGTVAVAAADGATLTLAFPAGALLSETTVTLTPVAAIGGLPFAGGLVAAVHVEPEGLRLLAPATLTVESPRLPAASARAGFGYSGSGSEFHLEPLRQAGAAVTLSVRHFSGYGVAGSTASERGALASGNPPSSPLDGAAQAAAAGATAAQLAAFLDAGAARITASLQSSATLDLAVTDFTAWSSLVDALGGQLGPHHGRLVGVREQLRALLRAALARAITEARGRCFSQHDVAAVAAVLRFARYAPVVPAPDVVPQAAAAVDACLRFELDVDVTLQEESEIEPATAVARVRGLPLRDAGGGTGVLTGERALELVSYHVPDYQCWSHTWSATPAAPFIVRSLRFDLALLGAGGPAAPRFTMQVGGGSLTEAVTHTCGGDPETTYTDTRDVYDLCFQLLLPAGLVTTWEYLGGDPWARSTATASGGCTGSATFTLRHTPAP